MWYTVHTVIINGTQLAQAIEERLTRTLFGWERKPVLVIVVVGINPVIERFVALKMRLGERIGVRVRVVRVGESESSTVLTEVVRGLAHDDDVDGIVVQLPLPLHMDTDAIVNMIPIGKDVDVLSREAIAAFARGDAPVLPPVAGAVQEILEHVHVQVSGEEVLVLGHGRLVGAPVSVLLRHNGAHVTVIDRPVADLATHVRESKVIISGVGKAGLITPEMLAPGSVVIDAGSSESNGKTVGDVDPRCVAIAGFFTPVPGGVGPLTVVLLFKNLLVLSRATAS